MIIEFEGEFMADYIIRATAADGQIRAFASTTRGLVEGQEKAHNTSPVATSHWDVFIDRRHDGFP